MWTHSTDAAAKCASQSRRTRRHSPKQSVAIPTSAAGPTSANPLNWNLQSGNKPLDQCSRKPLTKIASVNLGYPIRYYLFARCHYNIIWVAINSEGCGSMESGNRRGKMGDHCRPDFHQKGNCYQKHISLKQMSKCHWNCWCRSPMHKWWIATAMLEIFRQLKLTLLA